MSKLATKPATYQIRALDRGLDILESFSVAEPERGIGELAQATGIPKPTIVRLLSVLAERGYVERGESTERYRIGVRALELGANYLHSTSLEREAKPFLDELVAATNQTANLAVLQGFEVVHLEVVAPDRPVRFWALVGSREAAYYCGVGKALLAAMDDDALNNYLKQEFVARTPKTITSPDQFRREIERVRAAGYALDDEESSLGVRCIAASVYNRLGDAVAAISISGVKEEFGGEHLEELAEQVVAAAGNISARLGAGS